MSNRKAPFQYEILPTADGSPTMSLHGGEKMHSMEGALSESLYIYGPTIQAALKTQTPRILSMGLGLGYNEIITLALFIKNEKNKFKIVSYEIVPELRQSFLHWANRQSTELSDCYDSILSKVAEHYQIDPSKLRSRLTESIEKEDLVLKTELKTENEPMAPFNGVLYDAFSSATNNHLWTEKHLEAFIKNCCATRSCWFSTYAATGALKRTLRAQGFNLEKRDGFGKKRESTFAYR